MPAGDQLSAEPLLAAITGYHGAFHDLHTGLLLEAAPFHAGREALARRLAELGLEAGDRVLLAVSNGPQFVAALGAILAGGGSPILQHALTPPAELNRTAMRFGARWALADGPSADDLQTAIGTTQAVGAVDWTELKWSAANTSDPTFVGDYPALAGVPLHPTSGTTGTPKIAVRPGPAAVAEAANYIETSGISQSDAILVTPPMSHAYAYGMGVMVPMLSGARIVSLREFKPKQVFEAFAADLATVFPAVPAMLEVMLFGVGDRLRRSPRTVFAAGAPLPERVASQYREASGVNVRPLFGTTETGGATIAPAIEGELPAGCIGPAMRLVDAEPRPRPGEAELHTLWVRSPSMMAGYLRPAGIDSSAIVDGWFDTGDLAHLDETGMIHLRGRIAEVINVGGLKVVPSEVEEVIRSAAGVREVKVYAGASRAGAQFVKAAVVAEPGVSDAAIREHCSEQLIYYKRPSAVLLVDALPKTPSGKVILSELP